MLSLKNYTFKKETNLFGDSVLGVYRNSDKKHIISIGDEHIPLMKFNGFNPADNQQVLNFIEKFYSDQISQTKPKKSEPDIQNQEIKNQEKFNF